jgi:hypothetical protein
LTRRWALDDIAYLCKENHPSLFKPSPTNTKGSQYQLELDTNHQNLMNPEFSAPFKRVAVLLKTRKTTLSVSGGGAQPP